MYDTIPSMAFCDSTVVTRMVKKREPRLTGVVTIQPSFGPPLDFNCVMPHIHRECARKRWRGEAMDWQHLLASITGTVDQELLLRNESLVTETRLLRHQITGRVRLTDGERTTLAAIGQKLGKQALQEVATIVKPDTILEA